MMTGRQENDQKNYWNIQARLGLMPKFAEEWFYHLRANNLSSETCKDFVNKLYQYLSYISGGMYDVSDVTADQITPASIEQYLVSKEDKSNSYQAGIWSCLNNFLGFMSKRGYIAENYIQTQDIKQNNKKDKIERPYIAKEHFKKILRTASKGSQYDPIKRRDKAILLVFMTTGIRKMALGNIDLDDVDFDNGILNIIDKGEKIHEFILTKQTLEAIREWLEIRPYFLKTDTNALFISSKGNRISSTGLYKIVERVTEEALGTGYSPHKLRSGFITTMLEETGDIYLTADAVGHSSIKITQRYDSSVGRGKKRAAEVMKDL